MGRPLFARVKRGTGCVRPEGPTDRKPQSRVNPCRITRGYLERPRTSWQRRTFGSLHRPAGDTRVRQINQDGAAEVGANAFPENWSGLGTIGQIPAPFSDPILYFTTVGTCTENPCVGGSMELVPNTDRWRGPEPRKKPTGSSDSGGFFFYPAGWRRSRADSYNLPVQPEPRPCLMEPTELNNCDYRLSGALLLMYHSILKNNGGTGRNSDVIL